LSGQYPTSVTAYTNPGPTDTTATEIGTRSHDEFHADVNDDLEQVMTKLGTGASTPSAGTVLRGTGTGSTAYGAIVSGDITDDTIVNADINSAAAITVSKLAAGGTAARVVATATGATMAMQQIVGDMVAAETITNTHILDGTIRSFELEDGAVTTQKILALAVTNSQRVTGGTGGTTNQTSFVDFDAAMAVSYASSGGVLIAFFFATVTNYVVGDYVTLAVSINGTDYSGTSYQPASSQLRGMAFALGRVSGLAAGTYTIKPRWRTSNGANQALQVGSEATMLILECKR
jgi:hypothetical protein